MGTDQLRNIAFNLATDDGYEKFIKALERSTDILRRIAMSQQARKRVMILEKDGKFMLALGKPKSIKELPADYVPDEWWEQWTPPVDNWPALRAQLDLIFQGGGDG